MISDYHSKYRNISKLIKEKKDNAKFKDKYNEFKSHENKTLFNVSSCKCRSFSVCSCARDRKIPEREQKFLQIKKRQKKRQLEELMQLFQKKNSHPGRKKTRFELFQMKQQKSHDDKLFDPET